jgi:hypothetical protein
MLQLSDTFYIHHTDQQTSMNCVQHLWNLTSHLEFSPKVIVVSEVPLHAFILLYIPWTDSAVQSVTSV